ncbi:dihydrolipoyllysine-residue succinyltransferase [Candidatus Riesia pediculicola]|uniref:Dihydrolipoyllysine-residue succinyltransferase n=1 Tax=Riesia pediculicola (strain USDA) TaxID=515618 RepID=D4G837_RIEPU|nr:dihydrolipoyllysine-residue succinyltransferase [Candidatus Riesia pediculicola]ADD79558.1 2-oxoglutarate dehydrogenase, E2 component, dihydrolipoamide succinyltransferase [Candidatus Riesia pediculicola USDA]ARC53742.1 dihydrolipoamide succinyltransferase [Candidatus Riesia pediculicola]QOJ86382.1 dihydrolipoyllysine-residue succinyltransferase [Candidatus Riesia pediculicola]
MKKNCSKNPVLAPNLSESVSEANVLKWRKKVGDFVKEGELLVEIETDKIVLEISSPVSGTLESVLKGVGSLVKSREVLGYVNNCGDRKYIEKLSSDYFQKKSNRNESFSSPSLRRKILKDQNKLLTQKKNLKELDNFFKEEMNSVDKKKYPFGNMDLSLKKSMEKKNKSYKIIPMTNIRKCISDRLLRSKNNSVTLTTFNEINMQSIMNIRRSYERSFEKMYGFKMGITSFFVKACANSLKKYPEINASIDRENILYHNHIDINVAVSTKRGLITPILRKVEELHLVDIEKKIKEIIEKSSKNYLDLQDLKSGSFTITNGGIFGSLMSTPIINPPQSAILGMHVVQDRVISENKEIKISPMMYVTLSYDHRIIDGKEAIGFLLDVKESLENPILLLLS